MRRHQLIKWIPPVVYQIYRSQIAHQRVCQIRSSWFHKDLDLRCCMDLLIRLAQRMERVGGRFHSFHCTLFARDKSYCPVPHAKAVWRAGRLPLFRHWHDLTSPAQRRDHVSIRTSRLQPCIQDAIKPACRRLENLRYIPKEWWRYCVWASYITQLGTFQSKRSLNCLQAEPD